MGSRRALFTAALFAAALAGANAQARAEEGSLWGDRYRVGDDIEAALPSLKTVAIEDFESATATPWLPFMSLSDGVAESRIMPSAGTDPGRALGVRVLFMRRALSTIDVRPPAPIRIEGRCVGLSARAYGNGMPHELRLLVLDYYGVERELSLGRLDFTGWRRLEAAISSRGPGDSAFVQDDRHFRDPPGLRIAGLRIAFDLEESYGQYLVYFDDLEALVDSAGIGPDGLAEAGAGPIAAVAAGVARDIAPAASATSASADAAAPEGRVAEEAAAQSRARVLGEIERKIAAAMTYPEAARLRGIEGSISLAFRVDMEGNLASARIAKGSGSEILDRAGIELLRAAFPVANDSGRDLDLEVPITFRLGDARRD